MYSTGHGAAGPGLITPYWEKKQAEAAGQVHIFKPHNPLLGEKTVPPACGVLTVWTS